MNIFVGLPAEYDAAITSILNQGFKELLSLQDVQLILLSQETRIEM